jgi:GTPase
MKGEYVHTFLDEADIHVQGGNGGAGAMHFRREKYVPNGGPDGGDGGNGGDVVLRADSSINTLFTFKRRRWFQGEHGEPGGPARMHGRTGKDLVVSVPVGTIVRDTESSEMVADLKADGQTVVVARGGKGGLGNVHFKTSTNQAPGFAEKGEPGTERWLALELKLIADAGLIGLPNAGKSTLLSVITAARPKIAEYPFTTLSPNLGVVEADDATFVVADIPGLIEGAHQGVGLGHEFLRHIERTLVLVHVLDGSAPDPIEAFEQIERELALYDADLPQKPQIVAVNKLDIPEALERFPVLQAELKTCGFEAWPVSAVTHMGLEPLVFRMLEIVREQARAAEPVSEDELQTVHVVRNPDRIQVARKRGTFTVSGETAERLAVMTDMTSEEAVRRLQRRLKQLGVFTALQKAGVREGNTVRIGAVEFVWDETFEPEVKPHATARTSS